jgi:hypothetical protein
MPRRKKVKTNAGINMTPVNRNGPLSRYGGGPWWEPNPKAMHPSTSNIESCFIAGTKVKMADGTDKNIEDVVVGDELLGENNTTNIVKELDWVKLGPRKLYSFNDEDNYFVTSEHPFKTTDGWRSIDPYATKLESEEMFNQLTGDLDKGNILLTLDGEVELKSISEKEINNPELPLYNFLLESGHSYYTNGYLVHNGMCDWGWGPGGTDYCNCTFSCFHCTPSETCIPYANQPSCCWGACAALTESECDSNFQPFC